jgi:hypothetical protein
VPSALAAGGYRRVVLWALADNGRPGRFYKRARRFYKRARRFYKRARRFYKRARRFYERAGRAADGGASILARTRRSPRGPLLPRPLTCPGRVSSPGRPVRAAAGRSLLRADRGSKPVFAAPLCPF